MPSSKEGSVRKAEVSTFNNSVGCGIQSGGEGEAGCGAKLRSVGLATGWRVDLFTCQEEQEG